MRAASRRSFLIGLAGLIAAPAVVKAESLMQMRGLIMPQPKIIRGWEIIHNGRLMFAYIQEVATTELKAAAIEWIPVHVTMNTMDIAEQRRKA